MAGEDATKNRQAIDERVDAAVANLLRGGVLLAAAVVLAGGVHYLIQYGGLRADHHKFHGEPAELCSPWQIIEDAFRLDSRGIIQLGLLVLVATPVARVVFMWFAFLRQRDWLYVATTALVLTLLIFSMFGLLS